MAWREREGGGLKDKQMPGTVTSLSLGGDTGAGKSKGRHSRSPAESQDGSLALEALNHPLQVPELITIFSERLVSGFQEQRGDPRTRARACGTVARKMF